MRRVPHIKTGWIGLGLVLILGAALRLYDLGTESYWIDEIAMIERANASMHAILEKPDSQRSPVYILMAQGWVRAFGTDPASTRLLSALFGIAALGVMYAVGAELFDRHVALWSTLLMGASTFQISQSQNFRFYSLFVLMTLCSTYVYLRMLRTPKPALFVLYVIASGLLFYSNPLGILILGVHGLSFVLFWSHYAPLRRRWLITEFVLAALVSPGLWNSAHKTTSGTAEMMTWIPEPTLLAPVKTIAKFMIFDPAVYTWPIYALAAVIALGGWGLFTVWRRRHGEPVTPDQIRRDLFEFPSQSVNYSVFTRPWHVLLFVGLWLVIPIGALLLLSFLTEPLYVHRYAISAAPALYLFVAYGMRGIRRIVPVGVTAAVLAVFIVPGLREYYVSVVNENWPAVAAYIEEHQVEGDVIVMAPAENGMVAKSLNWYYTGSLPECGIDLEVTGVDALTAVLSHCTAGASRFWVVLRTDEAIGYGSHLDEFFLHYDKPGITLIDQVRFDPMTLCLFSQVPE